MIIFTLHSLERLRERKIKKEEVIDAIKNPDKELRENDIRKVIKRVAENKVLVVVYRKENEKIIIITAYKTSKIEKYLTQNP